ncbi:MAG: L-aspartate oxidase [Clostridiaceae bacterium]|jgi:L-aspartate oxidase|nr:L-aspartate oxidase [Clostridiaceae bacterium]
MLKLKLEENVTHDRYLVNFDTNNIPCEFYDVVIIGSGIAGVYTALSTPRNTKILIITKEAIEINNSVLAQGGIAVSLDQNDSPSLHFKDTLFAGAGLCDETAVNALVNEAADNIATLCLYGVNFDRDADKRLSLTREGAHSMNRIIHTGDATGKEVCDTLVSAVSGLDNVTIKEQTFAIDIFTEDGECKGVLASNEDGTELKAFFAPVVVCASGGYGRLYSKTTNPEVANGDGAALAYRAGSELMDLEFVQFHPTVLFHPDNQNFLISEAVRGEGALLRNNKGELFMEKYHPMKELAPRDVVSRAIFQEMQHTGSSHVFLDITHKDKQFLEHRFPMIYKTCLSYGFDMSKDFIPVAPCQHYSMGGIRTDEWGRTRIKGFYAVGEAACNGIHGANRLASNSLLEGLVFGRRIGRQIKENLDQIKMREGFKPNISYQKQWKDKDINVISMINKLQNIMSQYVGIIRSKEGLCTAINEIDEMKKEVEGVRVVHPQFMELKNMLTLAGMVVKAGLLREESRGAHFRSDFPVSDDKNWLKNIVFHGGTQNA